MQSTSTQRVTMEYTPRVYGAFGLLRKKLELVTAINSLQPRLFVKHHADDEEVMAYACQFLGGQIRCIRDADVWISGREATCPRGPLQSSGYSVSGSRGR